MDIEGPGNEDDDMSETDDTNMDTKYSIASFGKHDGSRKRKAGVRSDSGVCSIIELITDCMFFSLSCLQYLLLETSRLL